MASPHSRTESPYRQLTRHEKKVRRQVKREFIRATRAVTRFTLDFYGGRLDYLPSLSVEMERATVVARYREARTNYALVFGVEVVS
jgi:hypothetical protein